jgi:hypothetical protein
MAEGEEMKAEAAIFGLLVAGVGVGVPIARILYRLGFSPWLAILALLPLGNLIGLWLLG